MNGKMFSERIFLFDVDGTLTPHRGPMHGEFYKFFLEFARKNKFYLTTGSDLPKTKEQVPTAILQAASGIFCCAGNQLYTDAGANLVYENTFIPSTDLTDSLEGCLQASEYQIKTGNHIEHRPGMINFSVVGRNANQAQRYEYSDYDGRVGERGKIIELLKQKYCDLDFTIGGQISIDIFPIGNDKSISVRWVKQNEKVGHLIYMGDRAFPGGNDYAACREIQSKGWGVWFNVANYKETRAILKQLALVKNKDVI